MKHENILQEVKSPSTFIKLSQKFSEDFRTKLELIIILFNKGFVMINTDRTEIKTYFLCQNEVLRKFVFKIFLFMK